MGITEKGALRYGLEKDGVWHKDFEMRQATLEDMEEAIEAAGEGACTARVARHLWARTIKRLGGIKPEEITAELLAGLVDTEYGILSAAEESLRGKLAAASAASVNSGS